MDAGKLKKQIGDICPIGDISIGVPTDKSTWKVPIDSTATPAQIAALNSLLAAYDPNVPTPDDLLDALTPKVVIAMLFILATDVKTKNAPAWASNLVTTAYNRIAAKLGTAIPSGAE